jgi:hypothetical protein
VSCYGGAIPSLTCVFFDNQLRSKLVGGWFIDENAALDGKCHGDFVVSIARSMLY